MYPVLLGSYLKLAAAVTAEPASISDASRVQHHPKQTYAKPQKTTLPSAPNTASQHTIPPPPV